jgi:hypothetical protein
MAYRGRDRAVVGSLAKFRGGSKKKNCNKNGGLVCLQVPNFCGLLSCPLPFRSFQQFWLLVQAKIVLVFLLFGFQNFVLV